MTAVAISAAAACGGEDDLGFELGGGNNGGFAPGTRATVAQRLETPALRPGNLLISHWSKEGGDSVMTYCLEYDYAKYHSRWVAFRFDAITRARKVGRKDYDIKPQYPIDPFLNTSNGLESDARFNGDGGWYDHGHLCASADRLYSRIGNDNTFFMTNMSPMKSSFNSSYWSVLERYVQDKGRNTSFSDTLYVCKGGTINQGMTLGYVSNGRMPIPKYYFMALLKVKNGNYSSIAFWMEHKNYGVNPSEKDMAQHAISVDELEELTGIDFFHNLPDVVERACESRCDTGAWGL